MSAKTRKLAILLLTKSALTTPSSSAIPNTRFATKRSPDFISTDREPTADELKKIKQRKENEPLEHARTLSRQSAALKQGSTVSVVFANSPRRFFIRALADDDQYEKIGSTLAEIYAQETPPTPLDSRVAIYEIVAGGAYALQDSNGTWFRVIARQPPQSGQVLCHFVDVGVCEKFPVAALRLLPPAVHPVMSSEFEKYTKFMVETLIGKN
ncbi:unnamed protein product [Caenorhabditis sp. 36 PRJEB53466]|nr:unnamed protein product [Caenorhabditis sp. 36 PRJEB53466]